MGELHSEPAKQCRAPAYPTKLQILDTPELLEAHVPLAWLSHGELAGALGVLLSVNSTGCSENHTVAGAAGSPSYRSGNAAMVAPIHGGAPPKIQLPDRGFLACVAVAPPVFLSEEEALQVIEDELAQYGLDMSERNVELGSVVIQGMDLERKYDWVSERQMLDLVKISEPLEVDLTDPQGKVGLEYVAQADTFRLGGDFALPKYDLKTVADSVSQQVRKQGKGLYFGALYDPSGELDARLRWARGEKRDEAQTECKRLLRLQVKSFVEWLKGQGVI
ncbi:MAG: hypothetical protein ACYTFA_08225 [Planctomycetota bacterium]|jgi:hypothetical protein